MAAELLVDVSMVPELSSSSLAPLAHAAAASLGAWVGQGLADGSCLSAARKLLEGAGGAPSGVYV